MSDAPFALPADQPVIEAFLDTLWVEHGLSENTLSAYRNDLLGLSKWLSKATVNITEARRDHILDYLSYRVQVVIQYSSFLSLSCPPRGGTKRSIRADRVSKVRAAIARDIN